MWLKWLSCFTKLKSINMNKNVTSLAVLVVLFLFGTACNKNTEVCQGMIGPVSCTEFGSVATPTYEQVITCYETAVTANPQLSDSAMARSIFDCIKVLPTLNPPAKPLFDSQSRMCVEEWKLVLVYPRKVYLAFKNNITQSLERAKLEFPQDIDVEFKNAKADAFRNAYYGVLVAKATDTSFARQLAEAHMSCSPDIIYFHNDTVGIGLVRRFPAATVAQLVNLILEKRYYYSNDGIPADAGGSLVFLTGRRPYDVTYVGKTTNPDGPGDWNAIYYFNQTGSTIRGEAKYTGIGFPAIDNRRFNGTITASTINLNMSNPYSFEYMPGYVPCNNMRENFTILQDSLTGHWAGSNCTRGGDTKLKKQ